MQQSLTVGAQLLWSGRYGCNNGRYGCTIVMSYIEINKAVSQWLLTFNLCVSVTWPLTCAFHIPCTHTPEIIDMHRGMCDKMCSPQSRDRGLELFLHPDRDDGHSAWALYPAWSTQQWQGFLPCYVEHRALFWVEIHLPTTCPQAELVKVTLEISGILVILDAAVYQAVVGKQLDVRVCVITDVIYVQYEHKGA